MWNGKYKQITEGKIERGEQIPGWKWVMVVRRLRSGIRGQAS